MFGLKYMTRGHYTGFGKIVNLTSQIDGLLDGIVVAMTHAEYPTFLPILTFLTPKDKRDYIVAMATVSTFPNFATKGLIDLMERTKGAFSLRNTIAHCVWKKGRRAGAIKPLILSARGALKVLGIDHNEKEWTAPQLADEAGKIHQLGLDIATFMQSYGLNPALPRIRPPASPRVRRHKRGKPRQGR